MPIVWSISLCICSVCLADWPHWRGESRDDKTAQKSGWDGKNWQVTDPVWNLEVGLGSAAPLVIDNRVIAFGWQGSGNRGQDVLGCFELASGKNVWEQKYDAPLYGRNSVGDESLYSGPSSTPEYDAETGLLYSLSLDGELRCWDFKNKGNPVWRVNLYDQYKIERRPDVGRNTRRDYGYTTSPLVFGDWLLVEVGSHQAGNLVAFDKTSGKAVWGSECKDLAGHTGGPVLMKVEGVDCAAILTLRNLVVMRLDAKNAGKTVGTYEWTTDFANNIPTPAVQENSVIISTAYNHFATCRVDFSLQGGAKKKWEQPKLCTGVCSPLIDNGNVYWAWRGVHCLDFDTGELKWKGGNTNEAGSCVLTSDGRLIVWATRGDLLLVESAANSPDKYQQLAAKKLLSQTDAWPHVVVSDGCILCRDRGGTLLCLKINQQ